jgi:CBS-domain-containing membrane protein
MLMKNKGNKWHYVWQPALAFLFIWGVLVIMRHASQEPILSAIGVAALASSSLLVFARPFSQACTPGCIIGGYAIGLFCGILCRFIALVVIAKHYPDSAVYAVELFGALSVGISIVLMASLKMLHPPAAGMSEGLAVLPWDIDTIIVICIAITVLVLLRRILSRAIQPLG